MALLHVAGGGGAGGGGHFSSGGQEGKRGGPTFGKTASEEVQGPCRNRGWPVAMTMSSTKGKMVDVGVHLPEGHTLVAAVDL
jgi:hypothetical protein